MSPARQVPRFSICVPVWQEADLVHIAIESALAQTFRQWELIVGDNASIDDIELAVARYNDRRVRLERWTRHVSNYENVNRTVAKGVAEWLVPIGPDVRLHPDALKQMSDQITAAGAAAVDPLAMVVAPCRRVDGEGRPAAALKQGPVPRRRVAAEIYDAAGWLAVVSSQGDIPTTIGAIAFSRAAIAESGSIFRPEVGPSADQELIARLAAFGAVAYMDTPLVDCTTHFDLAGNRRYAFSRWRGEASTPIGAALISALAAHGAEREVSGAERRAVMAAVARTHLQRAGEHRMMQAGSGRRGALRDVLRAARTHPGTLLSRWGMKVAIGSIAASHRMIARAEAKQKSSRGAAGEQSRGPRLRALAAVSNRMQWARLPESVPSDAGVLALAFALLVGLLVLGGR